MITPIYYKSFNNKNVNFKGFHDFEKTVPSHLTGNKKAAAEVYLKATGSISDMYDYLREIGDEPNYVEIFKQVNDLTRACVCAKNTAKNLEGDLEKLKTTLEVAKEAIKDKRFDRHYDKQMALASAIEDTSKVIQEFGEDLAKDKDVIEIISVDHMSQRAKINVLKALENKYINMSFYHKKLVIKDLENFEEPNRFKYGYKDVSIKNIKKGIEETFKSSVDAVPIDKEEKDEFIKNFLLSGKIDEVNFSEYEQKGFNLKYKKEDFIKDFENIIENLSDDRKEEIYTKLKIRPEIKGGKIKDWEGILSFSRLNREDEIENKIYEISEQFLKENEYKTGNDELDKTLNALIKGIPEFLNLDGKIDRTKRLDVEAIKLYKNATDNPNFKTLSKNGQMITKLISVLSNIYPKKVAKLSPSVSSLAAKDILKKFELDKNICANVYELIKSQNMFYEVEKSTLSANIAATFVRRKEDFKIAKIITKAKEINLEKEVLAEIQKHADTIDKDGQLLFATTILDKNLLPKVEYKGKKYKVAEISGRPENKQDLSKIGFIKGTTNENARFLVHMVSNPYSLKNAYEVCNPENEGYLCASYISPTKKHTYLNYLYGLSFETYPPNIANASGDNQNSGGHKDFFGFANAITEQDGRRGERCTIFGGIRQELDLEIDEYKELYRLLKDKKQLFEIDDDEIFNLQDKKISGKEIKSAIRSVNDSLLTGEHNEINIYTPEINAFVAKREKLSDIPDEYLEFVQENDLPILLLKTST